MKGFLGIASVVTVAATGAAMAISRRAPGEPGPVDVALPDPGDVARALDAARERLRARASAEASATPRAA